MWILENQKKRFLENGWCLLGGIYGVENTWETHERVKYLYAASMNIVRLKEEILKKSKTRGSFFSGVEYIVLKQF
jgi:hypothetical protein